MLDPQRIAKFLHVEVPIRMAERIRWIRHLGGQLNRLYPFLNPV